MKTCYIGCGQAPIKVRSVNLAYQASPDRINYLDLGSMLRVTIVAKHLHVSIIVAVGKIRALKSGTRDEIMVLPFGSHIANSEYA